jgi:hypothetical protein
MPWNYEIATESSICKSFCLKSSFEIFKKLAPIIFVFFLKLWYYHYLKKDFDLLKNQWVYYCSSFFKVHIVFIIIEI